MKVLVAAATKHGATGEIARAIANTLRDHGLDATVLEPEQVGTADVAELLAATGARGHRVFAGKLVREQLAFPERAIVSALRVPDGDFRDWPEITGWAAGIATALRSAPDPAARS